MEFLLGMSILANAALVIFVLLDKRERDEAQRKERQELYNRISRPGTIYEELPDEENLGALPMNDDIAHHAFQGHQDAAQELAQDAEQALRMLNESA